VVSQRLLPHLWLAGALQGLRFSWRAPGSGRGYG
jgi:hypothetical protein